MYIMTRLIEQKPTAILHRSNERKFGVRNAFFHTESYFGKKESLNIFIFYRLISLCFNYFLFFTVISEAIKPLNIK